MRCFVAVDLTPALRQPLLRLLQGLPRSTGVHWCTENQLHVTLKFLGDVSDAQLARVCDVIAATSTEVEPFSIRLGTLGCFPAPRSPRVFWCGITDPSGACARWVELADPRLAELGFEREARAYTPHVTLGRSKDRDGSAVLQRALQSTAAPPPNEMIVTSVVLFESRLLPQGAQYTPAATAPLGQR
jgi:2'-5' RNA ligase